jgi:hypothetical protein
MIRPRGRWARPRGRSPSSFVHIPAPRTGLFPVSSSNLNPGIFAALTLVILLKVALILLVDRIRGSQRVAL